MRQTKTQPGRARSAGIDRGYTLIEVLVVAVIIVLLLGMALPVFRAITGSRSEAGASNIIAATLGRARTDAIGLQKNIGVAFFYNSSSQVYDMAEVGIADCPPWTQFEVIQPLGYFSANFASGPGVTSTYYFVNNSNIAITLPAPPSTDTPPPGAVSLGGPPLEMLPDTELLPLPSGIGVQTVCNCYYVSGQRATDGYLGLGVILFDGHGRIATSNYGISQYSKLGKAGNLGADFPTVASGVTYPYPTALNPTSYFGVPSQYGVVVFQQEAFVAQGFPMMPGSPDPTYNVAISNQYTAYTSGTTPSQFAEENWLDQNATPLLLNRYTGTLIKAE